MAERNRWAIPAAAGAAALAVVAGVVAVVAVRGSEGTPARPAAAPRPGSAGTAGRLAPPDAVVHDGDRIRAEGQVLALPGRPVRLCSGSEPDVGVAPGGSAPVPAYCELGITLLGADVARLGDRQERGGAGWGRAEVTGVYRARTVTVTGQRVPPVTDLEQQKPPLDDFPADCRPPAGGWPRGEVQALPGIDRANRYVAAHPEVLGSLSIGYPEPTRAGEIATQVLLIGTTGDVAEATRQVRRWYAGSLCVRSVPHSRAQMLAARAVLTAALMDPARRARYGLLAGAGETSVAGDPRTSMIVLVYDEQARSLRESAGADLVGVTVQLRKLA
jgi:hypothetical protein